jgi:hypothetical protein
VHVPQQEKHRFFSAKQSTLRKDVDCAFDLLKKRFNILDMPGRSYSQHTIRLIMRDGYNDNYHTVTSFVAPLVNYEVSTNLTSILQRKVHLTSRLMFSNLQSDLIKHV